MKTYKAHNFCKLPEKAQSLYLQLIIEERELRRAIPDAVCLRMVGATDSKMEDLQILKDRYYLMSDGNGGWYTITEEEIRKALVKKHIVLDPGMYEVENEQEGDKEDKLSNA